VPSSWKSMMVKRLNCLKLLYRLNLHDITILVSVFPENEILGASQRNVRAFPLAISGLEKALEFHGIHIVSQVSCASLVMKALPITQEVEPILRTIFDVEMFSTDILETIFEMQNSPRVYACDMTRSFSILVPRMASIGPDHAFQEFLRVDIIIIHCLSLDINRSSCHMSVKATESRTFSADLLDILGRNLLGPS